MPVSMPNPDELLGGAFAAEVKRLLGEKHLGASGGGNDDAASWDTLVFARMTKNRQTPGERR